MDSSATYPAEARRHAYMCDGTSHLLASAVLLPVSYMLFGQWDAAAIAALPPAFAFKRDVLAGEGWAQCAICLGLVGEGETVRRLPACGHLFHASCVDEWLRAHATCPLCRAAARPPV